MPAQGDVWTARCTPGVAERSSPHPGGMGFIESTTAPCVYYQPLTGIRLVTHVDDFLCIGPGAQLREFYENLHQVLDLKCELLGLSPNEGKVGTFLGRTIEWHEWGVSWRGDERILRDMLVEWNMDG